jgi:glycosyltransferase involved in cell wall biosynthesis
MKIAYFELKVANFYEDYSLNSRGYGGATCFAKCAKENFNKDGDTFLIFGEENHFKNLTENENKNVCIPVSSEILNAIKNGTPPVYFFPYLKNFNFFMCHHDGIWVNTQGTNAKSIHWSLMGGPPSTCHPNYDYSFLYDPISFSNNQNEKTKKIKIGKFVPEFNKFIKEDFIFQCSRHDKYFNTIEVAENCIKHQIKGYFAGPILDDYPLMNYIDNKHTFYLGLISEKEKNEYARKARMTTYLHKWNPPFNLSVIESLAQGTAILANKVGFFNYFLKDGTNGFEYNGSNFASCYEKALDINQYDCWLSANEYSSEEMLKSFYNNLKEIK